MRRRLLSLSVPFLAASLALAPGVALGKADAAISRGAKICGGKEYKLVYSDKFRTGRAAILKHRKSRTYCLVTFNTTKKTKHAGAKLIYKRHGKFHRARDAGRYRSYAGPIYLARPKKTELWYTAFVGKHDYDDRTGVAGFCVKRYCNNESGSD